MTTDKTTDDRSHAFWSRKAARSIIVTNYLLGLLILMMWWFHIETENRLDIIIKRSRPTTVLNDEITEDLTALRDSFDELLIELRSIKRHTSHLEPLSQAQP